MAITWDNADGKWEFYLDSVHRFSIDNFRTGQIVPNNSLIIIGQEQDEFSGGFSPDQALQGCLSRLNIWDTVLPVEVVVSFAKDPGYDNGNVLSWSFLRHHLSDIQASQPSNVVSSVGKSNVALTFSQMSNLNYAVLPYDGSIIAQLTVCTWIDLTASSTDAPCLISYATSTSFNEFYIFFYESKCLISLESQKYE
ncbi:Hypothetical predicted protein [Paramuricea clavata]|uniref:Pentraxin (PTX) domain-containing protein n=1 Tax=Paramuricea clavata TaxID=317549 RepID=A0A6S7IN97_PARCT|nr:Hypothetical predicted protein [Paramuricea clavata]